MNENRLLELIDAHLDNRQTDAEHAELEAALRDSEQWRQVYWEYTLQHAAVHQVLAEDTASATTREKKSTQRLALRRVGVSASLGRLLQAQGHEVDQGGWRVSTSTI